MTRVTQFKKKIIATQVTLSALRKSFFQNFQNIKFWVVLQFLDLP